MPGYNHYPNCSCGWCDGSGGGGGDASFAVRTSQVSVAISVTHPNAHCPVCHAGVFFYRSPAGGGVYFDELGPPWPKHPCMDSLGSAQQSLSAGTAAAASLRVTQLEREDWFVLRFNKLSSGRSAAIRRQPGDWWVIEATEVSTGRRVSVLVGDLPDMPTRGYFFVTPWNDQGIADMSWISHATGEPSPAVMEIRSPSRFADLTWEEVQRYELLPEGQVLGFAIREAITAGVRVELRVPRDAEDDIPAALVERLALEVERAVRDLCRLGWQEDRSDVERIELRLRFALKSVFPRPVGYDPVMRVLRAFA